MRRLTLALLGLMLATTPALAARRSGPAEGTRAAFPTKPAASMPAAKARPAPAGRLQMAAHRAGPAPSAVRVRPAAEAPVACGRKAPARCRGTGMAQARFGWTQGLPPAAGVQANECPDGTLATLARGHEDVVRCMPI